ncbi:MAG: hypothetical protein FWC98_03900, partial [Bacteroidales bacterium]|nr:hypothetical protein [Bacteroidales bacterium]
MKYLKFLALIPLTLIISATSCSDDPKKTPVPDPPAITITNPEGLVVNLQDILPYIQGSVTTEGELRNVNIFVTRGAMRQQIATHTTFENPKEFTLNFRPEYTLDMTGIRVQATDAHSQTTTLDFAFQVINQSTAPIITITNPEGMLVNLQNENHPYIQGSVISANDLTHVAISVRRGETLQKIKDITTFENPRNFAINFLPEYD